MQLSTSSLKVEAANKRLHLSSTRSQSAFSRSVGVGLELSVSSKSHCIHFHEFEKMENTDEGLQLSVEHKSDAGELALTLRIAPHAIAGLVFILSIENLGCTPLRINRLIPFRIATQNADEFSLGQNLWDLSIFKMGWQSWSATRAYEIKDSAKSPWLRFMREMEENPANPSAGISGHFVSEQMTILAGKVGGETIGMGFLTCLRGFGDIRVHGKKTPGAPFLMEASYHLDGIELGAGQSVSSEPLWFDYSSSTNEAAQNWADFCGKAMKARTSLGAPVGWCSWYHYYTRISEKEMHKNLDRLSELKNKLSVKFVQLDDGFQTNIGDWLTANDKFPSGVPKLMADIRDKGFAPGIWTAPFLARPRSKLFKDHPDWFLKDEKGQPRSGGFNPLWGGRVYALDPTHPEALGHIRHVFKILRDEWKVEFFKIDFCYSAALPATRYDPNSTRASALRLGLETIREAIGDAFLLGCGCPLGPAVGIVDAMRIGCDVTPKWDNKILSALATDENVLSTRHALRNVMTRAFMHGRLWINDPDCLMIRRRKNRLSLEEIQSMASVYAVTGGMLLLSDDMDLVEADRLDLAEKTIALRTDGARVEGLLESPFPDTAAAKTESGYLILIANWSDAPQKRKLNLSQYIPADGVNNIVEIWSGKNITAHNGVCDLGTLNTHESKLLQIHRPSKLP
jgi:alpha-galactosidase